MPKEIPPGYLDTEAIMICHVPSILNGKLGTEMNGRGLLCPRLSSGYRLCFLALLERLSRSAAAFTSGSNLPVSRSSGVSSRASAAKRPPLSRTQVIHLSHLPSEDSVSGAPNTTKPLHSWHLMCKAF